MNAPFISPELIAYLEEVYPDRLPSYPSQDIAGMNFQMGTIQVIRHLKTLYADQEEKQNNVLSPESPGTPAATPSPQGGGHPGPEDRGKANWLTP